VNGENCLKQTLFLVLFTWQCYIGEIKDIEMGWACSKVCLWKIRNVYKFQVGISHGKTPLGESGSGLENRQCGCWIKSSRCVNWIKVVQSLSWRQTHIRFCNKREVLISWRPIRLLKKHPVAVPQEVPT